MSGLQVRRGPWLAEILHLAPADENPWVSLLDEKDVNDANR